MSMSLLAVSQRGMQSVEAIFTRPINVATSAVIRSLTDCLADIRVWVPTLMFLS
jgi:hypothetical protein